MTQVTVDLEALLMQRSLTDEALEAAADGAPDFRLLPDACVIKIGGQSLIDRGRAAVFPLLDELVNTLPDHKMILGTGAGTRARHAYSVGLDLGMPTRGGARAPAQLRRCAAAARGRRELARARR